jgi:predicted nucleic acid-binding protein
MEEERGEIDSEEDEEARYFFDSYAIIEILKDNSNYLKYADKEATFTIYNLAEIYWSSLNSYGEEKAEVIYNTYKGAVVEITDDILKEAVKFRKEHKKKNLSYADCIGYIYAKRHNMRFLTGDKEFQSMENVEFVK